MNAPMEVSVADFLLPVKNVAVSGVANRGNGKTCILLHPEGVTLQGVKSDDIYGKLLLNEAEPGNA